MNQAREDINCEEVYSMGITGRGVGVAVLDTGIYLHEDFKDRVTAFADFVNHRTSPYDDNGHGTHIAAMIGGSGISSDGKYRGVAPGCSLISVKVLDQKGNGYATDVLTGLKWIRENRDRYNIRIVNISVGSLSRRDMTENSILVRGVNAAWDDGLVVVVAAGNHGPGRMTISRYQPQGHNSGLLGRPQGSGCHGKPHGGLLRKRSHTGLCLQAGFGSAGLMHHQLLQ